MKQHGAEYVRGGEQNAYLFCFCFLFFSGNWPRGETPRLCLFSLWWTLSGDATQECYWWITSEFAFEASRRRILAFILCHSFYIFIGWDILLTGLQRARAGINTALIFESGIDCHYSFQWFRSANSYRLRWPSGVRDRVPSVLGDVWGFTDPSPATTGKNAPHTSHQIPLAAHTHVCFALLCLFPHFEFQFDPRLCRLVKAGNSEDQKSKTWRHETLRNSLRLGGCCKLEQTVPLKESSFQNRKRSCSLQGKLTHIEFRGFSDSDFNRRSKWSSFSLKIYLSFFFFVSFHSHK